MVGSGITFRCYGSSNVKKMIRKDESFFFLNLDCFVELCFFSTLSVFCLDKSRSLNSIQMSERLHTY